MRHDVLDETHSQEKKGLADKIPDFIRRNRSPNDRTQPDSRSFLTTRGLIDSVSSSAISASSKANSSVRRAPKLAAFSRAGLSRETKARARKPSRTNRARPGREDPSGRPNNQLMAWLSRLPHSAAPPRGAGCGCSGRSGPGGMSPSARRAYGIGCTLLPGPRGRREIPAWM
jgi:hypothetical protein